MRENTSFHGSFQQFSPGASPHQIIKIIIVVVLQIKFIHHIIIIGGFPCFARDFIAIGYDYLDCGKDLFLLQYGEICHEETVALLPPKMI